jgi:hypothetical protein
VLDRDDLILEMIKYKKFVYNYGLWPSQQGLYSINASSQRLKKSYTVLYSFKSSSRGTVLVL